MIGLLNAATEKGKKMRERERQEEKRKEDEEIRKGMERGDEDKDNRQRKKRKKIGFIFTDAFASLVNYFQRPKMESNRILMGVY